MTDKREEIFTCCMGDPCLCCIEYYDEKIGKEFTITREQMKKIETNKEMKNFWDEVNKIKK